MDLFQALAYVGTAASAVVAATTLAISVAAKTRETQKARVESWQRLVVYQIIRAQDGCNFTHIKTAYLQEAQSLESFSLSKSEIQIDALRKILLSLVVDNLILEDVEGKYWWRKVSQPRRSLADDNKDLIEQLYQKSQATRDTISTLQRKVLIAVEESPGIQMERLHRALSEGGSPVTYELFHDAVTTLRYDNLLRRETDGRLFALSDEERAVGGLAILVKSGREEGRDRNAAHE